MSFYRLAIIPSKLFDEIPKRFGVLLVKVSFGILVKSYCAVHSPKKTIEILKQMEEKWVVIMVVTFTTILNAFVQKGEE